MEIFEYRADRLPHITYSGRQNSMQKQWCNIRRVASEYIFYFVVDGEIFLTEDGISYHLSKGDCLLLEKGKLHFGTKYTNCSFFYVHFLHPAITKRTPTEQERESEVKRARATWYTSSENGPFPKETIAISKRYRVEDRTAFISLCNMLEQLLSRQRFRLEHFNILGATALSEVFIELERMYARSFFRGHAQGEIVSERIHSVLRYLHTNYMRPLSSSEIENELSYNFDYLNQLFAKHLHISIFKLLENIRMEAAKHILQTSSISIKELAGEVGYIDEAYFSKVFKRRIGCTPTQYREGGAQADL